MMIRPASPIAAALLAAAVGLAACGKVGTLDQPGPLYGTQAKARWQAQQKAQAEAQAKVKEHDEDEPEPLPADRIQDPYTQSGPMRAHPIQGQPGGANPPAQPGLLPDPMTSPNPQP